MTDKMLVSTDIPELLQPGKIIPLPGRILAKPHGSLIWERKKSAILSSYLTEKYLKVPLYFIENDKALGIIILHKPTRLDIKELGGVQDKHLVDKEEIQKRWPRAKFLYCYPIELISKFDPPKVIVRTEEDQTWLPIVVFKSMEFSDPSELADEELFEAHGKLHKMWFVLAGSKEDIINYHIILKSEIERREFEHEDIDELDTQSKKLQRKLGDMSFRVMFYGSKGLIEEDGPGHEFHTAVLYEYKGKRLLINYGEKNPKNLLELSPDFNINAQTEFKSYQNIKFGPFRVIPIPIIHSSDTQKHVFLIKAGDKRVLHAIDILNWHSKDINKYVKNLDLAIIDGFSLNKVLTEGNRHASIKHQLEKWYTPDRVGRVVIAHLGKEPLSIGDDELVARIKEITEVSFAIATDYKTINLSETILKPYPNTHACRVRNSGDFQAGSFRGITKRHNGKAYRIIIGRLKGKTTTTTQGYRYPKDIWASSSARSHCKAHKGIKFEPATGKAKEKQTFNCECLDCGYVLRGQEHCINIRCPKCGGKMRRVERPGTGKK